MCDLEALKLTGPAQYDFRPTAASPLVDAGAIVPPYTDGFAGRAPVRALSEFSGQSLFFHLRLILLSKCQDIGAYEHGGELWKAGCEGLTGCVEPPGAW